MNHIIYTDIIINAYIVLVRYLDLMLYRKDEAKTVWSEMR